MTHICISNLTIIASDNGLSPGWHQAIIWTNAGILSIGPLETNFSEISIEIQTSSFKTTHLKMSSGKRQPFCLSLNVLTALRWMPQNSSDDESTLVQVMAWCCQATSHYLSQCWQRSMSPYGYVTKSQWVNLLWPEQNIWNFINKFLNWFHSCHQYTLHIYWKLTATGFWEYHWRLIQIIPGNGWVPIKQQATVETLYSTIYYSKYFIELNFDKSTQYVALWTHKRHPIPRPFGRAMECLLWVFQQKLTVL